ncbi:hypothetical protein SAMD00019534_117390 [Acytostelium subglobosum LB1]|uniref:hypothetical protein n=1 Tax=Acytostelium subglobosum LB1 TaxID=1410327 RepID=UPI00064480AE|nr:hypothetical protein SAMD00019534_117390 [Acytostelium subglobosum LB1]GAM28563.1 hypothetical protein SAMD00019534_117390 [Acytostelium subglobosum LB1]|eukprot:XP_012748602.1 hypothetical protein SAMD00019534_117390 [Acytostelium subglobosum LB1]
MSGKGKKGGDKGGELKPCVQIKVRHILCEKQSKALEAYNLITQEGKSFADVAMQFSEDKARQGGSLGWKQRGDLAGSFSEKAFSMPIGVVCEPIRTQFGYHVILVEDRK